MNSLSYIFGVLPALLLPQEAPAVITIRGRVVAVQAMPFQLNDATQMQVLVSVHGGANSLGEIVGIQFSIPTGAYEKWFKGLPSLEAFSVRPAQQREFILSESLIFVEPRSGGENIASQIKAWKAINGFNLNSLPFGKPIKSYNSTEWVHPIV